MADYYNIFESAFERFSIMTVDGKLPDRSAGSDRRALWRKDKNSCREENKREWKLVA